MTVTWKVFSLKYAMTREGACAVQGLRAPGVTAAALVPTHSLFAKVSGQSLVCSSALHTQFPPEQSQSFFLAESRDLHFNNLAPAYIGMLPVSVLLGPCHLPSLVFPMLLLLPTLWLSAMGLGSGFGEEVVSGQGLGTCQVVREGNGAF